MPGNTKGSGPGYYKGVILRSCVVAFALAVAWIAPVEWFWKILVYTSIMIVAVIVVSARKQRRRNSN